MSAAPAPPGDTYPRCGNAFYCGVDAAAPCPCDSLTLTPELTAALRFQFRGCLCVACLAALQGGRDAV